MNETLTVSLIIIAEISLVLFLIVMVMIIVRIRQQRKDYRLAVELVNRIKQNQPLRLKQLSGFLQTSSDIAAADAESRANDLLVNEKLLYSDVLKMFLGHDREKILQLDQDVEGLVDAYQHMYDQTDATEQEQTAESLVLRLRKENKILRDERDTLKTSLELSMKTIENMTSEYASMYEGGHKEGEQRLKNEMFKLRQQLNSLARGEHKPQGEVSAVPELDEEVKPTAG